MRKPYYLVVRGRQPGVYRSWAAADAQVHRFSNGFCKKFWLKSDLEYFVQKSNQDYQVTVQLKSIGGFSFSVDGDVTLVWISGWCIDDGTPRARAGLGVYFGDGHPFNVSSAALGMQTKSSAEVQAARAAITQAINLGIGKLRIYTESNFLVRTMTNWIYRFMHNGWRQHDGRPVRDAAEYLRLRKAASKLVIQWERVNGLTPHSGNVKANRLARRAAATEGRCLPPAPRLQPAGARNEPPQVNRIFDFCAIPRRPPVLHFIKNEGSVVVYTDGTSFDYGYRVAKAGIGVWFGENHPLNVSAAVKGRQTREAAVIQAARAAVLQALNNDVRRLEIRADSPYLINAMALFVHVWMHNGWKDLYGAPILYKEEFLKLIDACRHLEEVNWVGVYIESQHYGLVKANELSNRGVDSNHTYF